MAKLVDAPGLGPGPARDGSSSLPLPTRIELNDFFGVFSEAQMRDARSASQWFPPESAGESAKNESESGAQARRVFSPRRRCEPKISLAQTFFAKRSESEAILSKD